MLAKPSCHSEHCQCWARLRRCQCYVVQSLCTTEGGWVGGYAALVVLTSYLRSLNILSVTYTVGADWTAQDAVEHVRLTYDSSWR